MNGCSKVWVCRHFRPGLAAALLAMLLLGGCVSVPPQAPEDRTRQPQTPAERPRQPEADRVEPPVVPPRAPVDSEPVVIGKEEIIAAGLARAVEAFRDGVVLRPYAAVYSDLGGLRPVRLNDKARQASDSDTALLLESIRTLSSNPDVKGFAVFGLAEDQQGERWFVVHYENRAGEAQLRQYPLPPPADPAAWQPAVVERTQPVIF